MEDLDKLVASLVAATKTIKGQEDKLAKVTIGYSIIH